MRKNNYQRKLEALIAQGRLSPRPGTINELIVRHDGDCSLLSGGVCCCEPSFELAEIGERCGCIPSALPGQVMKPSNRELPACGRGDAGQSVPGSSTAAWSGRPADVS